MADFKDVMRTRENATKSNESLTSLLEKIGLNELNTVALLASASAICLHIRSLECTIDYLDSQRGL